MISALVMACAVSGFACQSRDAHAIADAIDRATDSEELRAQLVAWAWDESRFRVAPPPSSWDAHAGLATGPFQMWGLARGTPLATQASRLLWMWQRGGLAASMGYGRAARRQAYRRASQAAKLLEIVRAN